MHDKRTWAYMEEIEQATGKQIVRISTDDIDEMEEVRFALVLSSSVVLALASVSFLQPHACLPGALLSHRKRGPPCSHAMTLPHL